MISPTADRIGISLPPDVDQKLRDTTRGIWQSDDRKQLSSKYPSYTLAKDAMEDDDFTLGELLNSWEALQIGRSSDQDSGLVLNGDQ